MKKIIIFGSSGVIGKRIRNKFKNNNFDVVSISPTKKSKNSIFWPINESEKEVLNVLGKYGKFDSAVWAQGTNINDNIFNFNENSFTKVLEANLSYILITLNILLKTKLLNKNAKLCIISSIWQEISKNNKLSYSISKSALKGAINSLSIDLGKKGHLINCILPSAVSSKMTSKNLGKIGVEKLSKLTYFNKLININDIVELAYFLCSDLNTSISGDFIKIDLGMSNGKII